MPDIVHAIETAPLVDLVLVLALIAAFIMGVMQGAVRRLIGIASILVAFLVAANLRDPVGGFLADNWTQFPAGYDRLIAFAVVFCVIAVGASVVTQGFYKRTDIYARQPVVDELVGGILGVVQGVLLIAIAVVIFESYTFPAQFPGEIDYLRQAKDMLIDQSHVASAVSDGIVPRMMDVLGALLPGDLVSLFR